MPCGVAPVAGHPSWDFARPSPLPEGWVNNGFSGWDGRATIFQPAEAIAISLTASAALGIYILYSPSRDAGFFCFEPVSHPVDAHITAGQAGLVPLAPGATTSATMRLDWKSLDPR